MHLHHLLLPCLGRPGRCASPAMCCNCPYTSTRCGCASAGVLERVQAQHPVGSVHMAFNVSPSRFQAAAQWIGTRATLLSDPQGWEHFALDGAWQSHSVYFAGPDGAVLELIARRLSGCTGRGRQVLRRRTAVPERNLLACQQCGGSDAQPGASLRPATLRSAAGGCCGLGRRPRPVDRGRPTPAVVSATTATALGRRPAPARCARVGIACGLTAAQPGPLRAAHTSTALIAGRYGRLGAACGPRTLRYQRAVAPTIARLC